MPFTPSDIAATKLHIAIQHSKCSYCNWGTEFLISINFNLNTYLWLVTTILDRTVLKHPSSCHFYFLGSDRNNPTYPDIWVLGKVNMYPLAEKPEVKDNYTSILKKKKKKEESKKTWNDKYYPVLQMILGDINTLRIGWAMLWLSPKQLHKKDQERLFWGGTVG